MVTHGKAAGKPPFFLGRGCFEVKKGKLSQSLKWGASPNQNLESSAWTANLLNACANVYISLSALLLGAFYIPVYAFSGRAIGCYISYPCLPFPGRVVHPYLPFLPFPTIGGRAEEARGQGALLAREGAAPRRDDTNPGPQGRQCLRFLGATTYCHRHV